MNKEGQGYSLALFFFAIMVGKLNAHDLKARGLRGKLLATRVLINCNKLKL